jgi:ETC complex I subunit conserved region
MKFKIFQPAKSAMQSGKKNTKKWLMVPLEENNIRSANPLTGWISAADTSSQLRFEFINKEEAIKFAENKKFEYEIHEPKVPSVKKKSYAANFTS